MHMFHKWKYPTPIHRECSCGLKQLRERTFDYTSEALNPFFVWVKYNGSAEAWQTSIALYKESASCNPKQMEEKRE